MKAAKGQSDIARPLSERAHTLPNRQLSSRTSDNSAVSAEGPDSGNKPKISLWGKLKEATGLKLQTGTRRSESKPELPESTGTRSSSVASSTPEPQGSIYEYEPISSASTLHMPAASRSSEISSAAASPASSPPAGCASSPGTPAPNADGNANRVLSVVKRECDFENDSDWDSDSSDDVDERLKSDPNSNATGSREGTGRKGDGQYMNVGATESAANSPLVVYTYYRCYKDAEASGEEQPKQGQAIDDEAAGTKEKIPTIPPRSRRNQKDQAKGMLMKIALVFNSLGHIIYVII